MHGETIKKDYFLNSFDILHAVFCLGFFKNYVCTHIYRVQAIQEPTTAILNPFLQ